MKLFAPKTAKFQKKTELKNACKVLEKSFLSTYSFYDIFKILRKSTSGNSLKRGSTTDEEQDLLRAMLLFSASGLDSTIKQLIKDSLHSVTASNEGANKMLADWVDKKMKKYQASDNENSVSWSINSKMLSSILNKQ